jgi:hypothetical protein
MSKKYLARRHFHNVMINPHFNSDFYKQSKESQIEFKLNNFFSKFFKYPKILLMIFYMPIKSFMSKIRSYF